MLILNKARKVHNDEIMLHSAKLNWVTAHRLDFETSGCLLVCDPEHFETYSALFRGGEDSIEKRAKKIYLAGTCASSPLTNKEQKIEGFVVSRYRRSKKVQFLTPWSPDVGKKWHSKRAVVHKVAKLSALDDPKIPEQLQGELHWVELVTGARHQIRAYFASLGTPLQGDPVYGESFDNGLSLHAWKLEFTDPLSGEKVCVVAPDVVESEVAASEDFSSETED